MEKKNNAYDRYKICNKNITRTLTNGKQMTYYPIKMAKTYKQAFCGKANPVTRKHMKSCPNPLEIREMQIKVIMRFIITSSRLLERSRNANCWWDIKSYLHVLPREMWAILVLWKVVGKLLLKRKMYLSFNLAILLMDFLYANKPILLWKDFCKILLSEKNKMPGNIYNMIQFSYDNQSKTLANMNMMMWDYII